MIMLHFQDKFQDTPYIIDCERSACYGVTIGVICRFTSIYLLGNGFNLYVPLCYLKCSEVKPLKFFSRWYFDLDHGDKGWLSELVSPEFI